MEAKEEPHGSLEKTMASFESKLQRVEMGLKLLDVLHYSVDGKYTLEEIFEGVTELKVLNEVIRSKVDAEKEILESMTKQRERLKEVRMRMNHVCYHLPDSLPEVARREQAQETSNPDHLQSSEVTGALSNKENKQPVKQTKQKKLPKSIQPLQSGDFDKIPKHVKGHLTMEQINVGISEVNLILEKKFNFLRRPRKTLSRAEETKRSVYLEMGKDLKGTACEIFFLDSDVQHCGGILKTKPKTKETVFLVLRHLGKMKEIRKGKPPRYCILGG